MNKVVDEDFLAAVSKIIDRPGTEVAANFLAEIAPGMLLAREIDGEVLVYVNLKTYKQNPEYDPEIGNLRERNLLPEDMGVVQNVMEHSLIGICTLARRMVVKKNGSEPGWYRQPLRVR